MLSLNCFSCRLKRDLMWEFISKTFQLMLWTMQMIWTESWLWATKTVRSFAVGRFIAQTEQRSGCETTVRDPSPAAGKIVQLSRTKSITPPKARLLGQVEKAMPPTLASASGGNDEGEDAKRAASIVRTTSVCLGPLQFQSQQLALCCGWEVVSVFWKAS